SNNIDHEFIDNETLISARNKLFSLNHKKWEFHHTNKIEKSLLAKKFGGLPLPVC
ncbi:unnamed protein product, partial [marine sediment metagenome]